jgi:hypothetical protein
MRHVSESDLALYASNDLSGWPRWATAVHVRRCVECRELVEAYRMLRVDARGSTPPSLTGLDWERLSAEMAANIHVGLAAGRCVPPLEKKSVARWAWQPVAVVTALSLVVGAAWWLNVPASDRAALYRVMRGLPVHAIEDRGPVVAATSEGIEFRENGSSLGVGLSGAQLVETSLSVGGSASARYVDDDADQVTITAVYVQ